MKTSYPLTSKSQITVPKQVREHLGLKPGRRAKFRIKRNGEVTISRPPTIEEIRAKLGKPDGTQPLTAKEKLIGEYLAKKYDVNI